MSKLIAVTGATGIIGSWIVKEAIDAGHSVRILTRKSIKSSPLIQVHKGDLTNKESLSGLLKSVDSLFHCGGEIADNEKMNHVNVGGTKNLLSLATSENPNLKFVHISSAGVIGDPKKVSIITEESKANPQNVYEISKQLAEEAVLTSPLKDTAIILRPLNVVEKSKPGVAELNIKKNLKNFIKTLLFGNEFAHMIHAKTVAKAAIYLESHSENPHGIFFVSNDHDPQNRYRYIWTRSFFPALPRTLSKLIRRILGGHFNTGSTIYSSGKLQKLGFNEFCTVEETLKLLNEPSPFEKFSNAP